MKTELTFYPDYQNDIQINLQISLRPQHDQAKLLHLL
jgi:hypothetical protein